MKRKLAVMSTIVVSVLAAAAANAATPGHGQLSGAVLAIGKTATIDFTKGVTLFATPIEAVKLPGLGTFGSVSLTKVSTLPGFSKLKLPLIGTLAGVPDVSEITVAQGVVVFEDVSTSVVTITVKTVAAKLP